MNEIMRVLMNEIMRVLHKNMDTDIIIIIINQSFACAVRTYKDAYTMYANYAYTTNPRLHVFYKKNLYF